MSVICPALFVSVIGYGGARRQREDRDRLGHANQTVTQQIYAHPSTGATAPLRR